MKKNSARVFRCRSIHDILRIACLLPYCDFVSMVMWGQKLYEDYWGILIGYEGF